jgi:transcriptional regulator with XRE-family HTH domain
MSDGFLSDASEDVKPLTGDELRDLRVLAGFSRSALEKAAGLSAGRVRAIENGYLRLRCWESAEIRELLFKAMQSRAREIEEHLRAADPTVAQSRESSSP